MCGLQIINNFVSLVETVEILPNHVISTEGYYGKIIALVNGTPVQWFQVSSQWKTLGTSVVIADDFNNAI